MARSYSLILNDILREEATATAMWSVGNDTAAEAAEHRANEYRKELKEIEEN